MTDNHLKQQLELFDLSPIEADIYLYLSGKNPQTVVKISSNLKLPRTTIYDNMVKLIDRGLVERIVKYKSQEFRAHPVSILHHQIEKEQSRLDQLENAFDQLQKNLKPEPTSVRETQARYYHGKQGLQQMMHNALEANREIVGYSVYGRVEIVGERFIKKWVAEFDSLNLKDRVITNPRPRILSILQRDLKPGVHQQEIDDIRYLPEDQLYVSGDITIYNQTVAISYWLEGEIVGVEIDNPEYSKNQVSIFNLLWQQAKPISELLQP